MKIKIKLLKDIMVDEKAYLKDSVLEVSKEYSDELIEAKEAELFVERNISVVEKEAEVKTEAKKIEKPAETKKVDLGTPKVEVKEVKLSPEQKLINSAIIAKAVATGVFSKEAKAIQGQGETVTADGGALVDEEIVDGIFSQAVETGQIVGKVAQRPVGRNANALELKQLNESTGTPADYNGVVLSVIAEGGVISPQKRAYKIATASVNKLGAIIPFTSEILEDGAHGIVESTQTDVGKAFGMKLDNEILYGTDSLLTAAVGDAGSVAVTLADASAPTFAEITAMYMSQIMPANAEWYMSGAVYESLIPMEDTAGNAALVPNYNVSPFGTLLGRPVNVVSCMLGADGEAGTIGFCDFGAGYTLGVKGGIKQAKSVELYWDSDQTAYRWLLRVAGLPTMASPVTLADARTVSKLVFGTDTP